MRTVRAGAAFFLVTPFVVGLLAWWGWPRPVWAADVPGGGVGTGARVRLATSFHRLTPPPWLVLEQSEPTAAYWAVDPVGRAVRGPWSGPARGSLECQDAAGRLLFSVMSDGARLGLVALDPATGGVSTVLEPRETAGGFRFSEDGSSVAFRPWREHRVEVADTRTGQPRGTFPLSHGGEYGLSPNGGLVALDAPSGSRSTAGVEVFDTRTGARVHQFSVPVPATGDRPAAVPGFRPDGRHLTVIVRRVSPEGHVLLVEGEKIVYVVIDLLTGEVVEPAPAAPDPDGFQVATWDIAGGRTLWGDAVGTAVRVTYTDGRPPGAWRPVPAPVVSGSRPPAGPDFALAWLVPGRNAALYQRTTGVSAPAAGSWRAWLETQFPSLRRPDAVTTLDWLDLTTGDLRPFPNAGGEAGLFGGEPVCLPDHVVLVVHGESSTRVEAWSAAPPPREPWPWAVPAGLVAGTAAAYLAGRRRTKPPPPVSG